MTRDSVRAALPAVALTASAALSGWYVMTTAGPQWQVLTCWFVVALFATMMSYFSVRASREMKRADPRRRFWTALGAASAIWAAGEWAQLAGAVRSPSSLAAPTGTGVVRTTALLPGCVVVTVVVLTYPIPYRSPHERLCYLLDLATVVTAAAGVAAITAVVVARQLTAFVDNAELLRQRDILTARLHTMAFSDSLIDLDDFKPVNDAYGHAAGDAMLVETAVRLRAGVGPGGVVARLGGDEFAVLTRRPHLEDITAVADEIARAVAEPYRVPGG